MLPVLHLSPSLTASEQEGTIAVISWYGAIAPSGEFVISTVPGFLLADSECDCLEFTNSFGRLVLVSGVKISQLDVWEFQN